MNIEVKGKTAKVTVKTKRDLQRLIDFTNERHIQHSIVITKNKIGTVYTVYLYFVNDHIVELWHLMFD